MKLVPFQPEYLRPGEALPFGLRDATGQLLLAAGQRLDRGERMAELLRQRLYADETESAGWFRRLAAAMDASLRQGHVLHQVAAARPVDTVSAPAVPKPRTLPEEWTDLVDRLDAVLRDVRAGGDWQARLGAVHEQARALAARHTDASIYHLVYETSHSTHKYSSHHALLTMIVCEHAAPLLGWPLPWVNAVGRAALVMNVAMLRLQDMLAAEDVEPTPEMRAEIDAHAERGAQQLEAAGCDDALLLDVVRLHHDASHADVEVGALEPARRLARLLRRVDIFSAQISLRASRAPISPVQAARHACLSSAGVPDEIGAALLRTVGLYPPGSFVELACGEIGLVVARGRRANLPYVAALVSPGGNVLAEPALRDTLDRRYVVKGSVAPSAVKVRPPHAKLLAMRDRAVRANSAASTLLIGA